MHSSLFRYLNIFCRVLTDSISAHDFPALVPFPADLSILTRGTICRPRTCKQSKLFHSLRVNVPHCLVRESSRLFTVRIATDLSRLLVATLGNRPEIFRSAGIPGGNISPPDFPSLSADKSHPSVLACRRVINVVPALEEASSEILTASSFDTPRLRSVISRGVDVIESCNLTCPGYGTSWVHVDAYTGPRCCFDYTAIGATSAIL